MAMLPDVFNSNDHEPMGDFEPIPANLYMLEITKSEVKDTKAKTGKRLNFQAKVIEGKYKGRIIFIGLNLVNPNPEAVKISQRELSSLCQACGVDAIEDSTELHGIPFGAKVGIKPASGGFEAQNVIKKYFPEDEMSDEYDPEPEE